ncbi:MAG TPA: AlkA N-terminal domain-containing protein, partial [Actinomycetota bacterium]|nr:AlkA N-terminal domain-containing protein [Actinomycetota bacterium]
SAVDRSRRLLDLDADPDAVAGTLRRDPVLKDRGPFKKGTRLPGTVDGFEIAARAILGQQVSVAAARKLASRLVGLCGDVLAQPDHGLTHRFPTPRRVVAADLGGMGVPSRRLATLKSVALRAAEGRLDLDAGADRTELQRSLVEIPGVGPWTASYIAMRLGDPDVFLSDDLGVKRALGSSSPVESEELAANWSPWRSYAVLHLWNSTTRNGKEPAKRRSAS